MKKDISSRSDIQLLIDSFYEKVRKDHLIGYLFNDVARVNWEHHLPRMYDFWENVIFQTGSFSGNPMIAHAQLHQKSPLTKEHFDQWLKLFVQSVDEIFEGEKAAMTKLRATSIAGVMQQKILQPGSSSQIY